VNAATVNNIPGLFARNERVICRFDTLHGPMVMVLVGAIFVGSIETTWAGEITPGRVRRAERTPYRGSGSIRLVQGEEMGRFNMGSTVILLLPDGPLSWQPEMLAGETLNMGQLLGRFAARP
jgi:phosphatidylserine decarboxylase